MLVIDANVMIAEMQSGAALSDLPDADLAAPPLMWSEAMASLRIARWRGLITEEDAAAGLDRLEAAPVARKHPRTLRRAAWRIAADLGWARTYDAEYVALAQLLGCRLVTLDARLRRGADRLGIVLGPTEL